MAEERDKLTRSRITIAPNYSDRRSNQEGEGRDRNTGINVDRIERRILYRRGERGQDREDLEKSVGVLNRLFRSIEGERRRLASVFRDVAESIQGEGKRLVSSFEDFSDRVRLQGRTVIDGLSRIFEGVGDRLRAFDFAVRRARNDLTSLGEVLNQQERYRREVTNRFLSVRSVLSGVGEGFGRTREDITNFFKDFSREIHDTIVEGLFGPFSKVVYATERGFGSIIRFARERVRLVEDIGQVSRPQKSVRREIESRGIDREREVTRSRDLEEERVIVVRERGSDREEPKVEREKVILKEETVTVKEEEPDRREFRVERESAVTKEERESKVVIPFQRSLFRYVPTFLPSVLRIEDSELIQESGSIVRADRLNVFVRRGIKVEGLQVSVQGGGGLLDMLGLRGLFSGLGAVTRFLPLIGVGAGIGIEALTRGSIKEGVLTWLFGSEESSRLSNLLSGIVKGAITGLLLGPKGAIVGAVIGGVMGLFGKEMRKVISSVSSFFDFLKEQVQSLFTYFSESMEKFFEGLTSILDRITNAISSIVSKVVYGARVIIQRGVEAGRAVKEKTGEAIRRGVEVAGRGGEWVRRLLSEKLGWVSQLFESGRGKAGPFVLDESLVTKVGRTGAGAYVGPWQMTEETFYKFARRYGYDRELRGYVFASEEWQRKWREIVRREGAQKIGEQMREYIAETHYLPLIERMGNIGRVLAGRGRAVQEMLYAIAVQYGSNLGARMIRESLRGLTEEQLQRMTDEEIISRVMQYKRETLPRYFTREPQRILESMRRADIEKEKLLLQIAREERLQRERVLAQLPESRVREQSIQVQSIPQSQVRNIRHLRETQVTVRNLISERAELDRLRTATELRSFAEEITSKISQQRQTVINNTGYAYDIDRIPTVIDDMGAMLLLMGVM